MTHETEDSQITVILANPLTGSLLTIASGLAFLFLLMILPLVGAAGYATSYYRTNFTAFLCVLLFSLLLAVLAVISKMARRKIDGSPLPWMSICLCGVFVVLLISLLGGLLHI